MCIEERPCLWWKWYKASCVKSTYAMHHAHQSIMIFTCHLHKTAIRQLWYIRSTEQIVILHSKMPQFTTSPNRENIKQKCNAIKIYLLETTQAHLINFERPAKAIPEATFGDNWSGMTVESNTSTFIFTNRKSNIHNAHIY